MINESFWKSKRIFLTGHTGFKGSWLSIWLSSLGAKVRGYSLEPNTTPSLFHEANVASIIDSQIGDIRDKTLLQEKMLEFEPDIIIHMAAQPLVRYSYQSPLETYEINVMGTVKVFEAARNCSNLKAILNITSDKCYENDGRLNGYNEQDPMGGYDPYSSSKGCAELLTSSYRRSFFEEKGIGLASVRAGNVIGGGDWADDRLLPDILRSFEKNEPVIIRNPDAIRPWQHVLEPLSGYLLLLQKLWKEPKLYSESWNFGPNNDDIKSVKWIIENMIELWPGNSWKLDEKNNAHESSVLSLDISKALNNLGWTPSWDLQITLKRILKWHRDWLDGADMHRISLSEINEFTKESQV